LGVLRLKERGYLPVKGVKVLSATVNERAGRWFVSVQVQEKIADPMVPDAESGNAVGVDLGISHLAVVSDGTVIENPRALRNGLKAIKRLQREVSRRKPGSANRKKAVAKLAKAHGRVRICGRIRSTRRPADWRKPSQSWYWKT
jgi:putative transposase